MKPGGLGVVLLIYAVQVGLLLLVGTPGFYAAAIALGGCLVYIAASS